jgi:hypothetical protein
MVKTKCHLIQHKITNELVMVMLEPSGHDAGGDGSITHAPAASPREVAAVGGGEASMESGSQRSSEAHEGARQSSRCGGGPPIRAIFCELGAGWNGNGVMNPGVRAAMRTKMPHANS